MTAKDKTYLVKWIVPRPNPLEFDMGCAGMKDRKEFEARMAKELKKNGSEEIFEILHEFLGVTPVLEFRVVTRYTSDWGLPSYDLEFGDSGFEFNIYFRGKRHESCVIAPPLPSLPYEVKTLSHGLYFENALKEWTERVKEYIFGLSGSEFKVGRKTTMIPDFKTPAELKMKLQPGKPTTAYNIPTHERPLFV